MNLLSVSAILCELQIYLGAYQWEVSLPDKKQTISLFHSEWEHVVQVAEGILSFLSKESVHFSTTRQYLLPSYLLQHTSKTN